MARPTSRAGQQPFASNRLLARQWLGCRRHLKANSPYLFLTAAHRNPFQEPGPA